MSFEPVVRAPSSFRFSFLLRITKTVYYRILQKRVIFAVYERKGNCILALTTASLSVLSSFSSLSVSKLQYKSAPQRHVLIGFNASRLTHIEFLFDLVSLVACNFTSRFLNLSLLIPWNFFCGMKR